MQKIYIKEDIIPNMPGEPEGFTIGWKIEVDSREYGDFMYITKEGLALLKEELCKK